MTFVLVWVWGIDFVTCQRSKGRKGKKKLPTPLIKRKHYKNKVIMEKKMCTLDFFTEETFTFVFLLVPESLALIRSFKVKSPWKTCGTSTCWAPFSPKSLTHSLMSDHHDLNLGEGSPTPKGEVKGILELDSNILMRFSLLKPKEATTVGKAKVEKCPNAPWSKPNWRANLWGL